MKPQIWKVMAFCVLMLLPVTSAWSDTEVRPATPFEKDYVLKVLTGFDRAVSQGPADWTETDRTEVKAPEHMAVGAAWGPLQVNFMAEWEDREAKAKEAERRDEAIRSIEAPDENVMDEISREMDRLAQEMALAAQNGDRQAMQRLQQKAEQLSARSEAAFASTNSQIRKVQENAARNMDIELRCAANTFNKSLENAVKQAPVSGWPVYRVEYKEADGEIPGASYVFIGDWEVETTENRTDFRVEPRADRIPASVQTVVVTVRAEDKLARNMLETIDWNVLKNLSVK